jgi:hypothetical protein
VLLRHGEIADAILAPGADFIASAANCEPRKRVYVERWVVCWKTNGDDVIESLIARLERLDDNRVWTKTGWSAISAIATPGLPPPDKGLSLSERERRGEWNEKCEKRDLLDLRLARAWGR